MTTPDAPALIQMTGIKKVFLTDEVETHALQDIHFNIKKGEYVAISGPSGCGKTTLLSILGLLDTPSGGQYLLEGQQVSGLAPIERARVRNRQIGFIFQAFNLIPTLTAKENILLPLSIAGREPDPEWFARVIDTVGLSERLGHRPTELSGGQQQRVACARALVSRPAIIFADEPTGNLDSKSSREVLEFLRRSVTEFGQTIVMVTHDPSAASYTDRVLFLADGRVVDELREPTAESVLERMGRLDGARGV